MRGEAEYKYDVTEIREYIPKKKPQRGLDPGNPSRLLQDPTRKGLAVRSKKISKRKAARKARRKNR